MSVEITEPTAFIICISPHSLYYMYITPHRLLFVYHPTAFKGCAGIVLTHGVWLGGVGSGKILSGLYLRKCRVQDVDTR